MKQAELQDIIEWEEGMEYAAVDRNGEVFQFCEMPELINGKYWVAPTHGTCAPLLPYIYIDLISDPENWLFKKEGEMK